MGSYTIERFGSIHPRVQTNCGLGNTILGHELDRISVNSFGEGWMSPSTKSEQIGWRPVLTHLSKELYQLNIGKRISFGCDGMTYKGELIDFNDYDLVVDFVTPLPQLELGHAVQVDDFGFVFDCTRLDFIHEL